MSVPSLVMIPGVNCTARLFQAQGTALADSFAVSIARHGRHMTIAADAEAILADAPDRFTLMGLSMGGYLALEIVRQAPERVERLVLLDTSARPDTPEQTARRHQQIAMAEEGRFDEVVDMLFPVLVHPSRHGDAELRKVVAGMAADTGPERFVVQQRAIMGRPDSRPGLPAIACPTLVVVGDGDALTPPHLAEEIAAAIPGAVLFAVPACGHLSTLEKPEEVTGRLVAWLAEAAPAPAANAQK